MNDIQLRQDSSFSFTPQNLDEAMKYAKLIADSDLAPKDYRNKPGNVIVAMQMGHEVGLKPMQALQNIAVINGRPSIWGDAMIAIVMAHPDFEDCNEWIENGTAYCMIKRKGRTPQTRHFSIDQAKKAGLWGKGGPWTQYPERMLQMRARAFACRDVFADALKGIHSAEEVSDMQHVEVVEQRQAKKEELQKQIGNDKPTVDFYVEFKDCETKEELQAAFNNFKSQYKDKDNLTRLVKAKDQRKAELEAIDVPVEVVENPVASQSNEEWVNNFTGEVKPE